MEGETFGLLEIDEEVTALVLTEKRMRGGGWFVWSCMDVRVAMGFGFEPAARRGCSRSSRSSLVSEQRRRGSIISSRREALGASTNSHGICLDVMELLGND